MPTSVILSFLETGKSTPVDTIRHLMARFAGSETAVRIPFEAKRVKTNRVDYDRYFDRLDRILVDCPADMVVNLDETSHCEWMDAQTEILKVPKDFRIIGFRFP
jgi:hypothetical protein